VRLGTTPVTTGGAPASRINHPVLLPDDTDLDDEIILSPGRPSPAASPAATTARPPQRIHWYAYVASGIAGAVLVTGMYGLLASRSGASGNRGSDSPGGVVSDTALLDRRADTLALAISAFSMRAGMYDTRRMPCSGLGRGLTQVEDAWLGYNLARKDMLAASDPARDARDKSLYADVRAVEVRFERSGCTRP
jgi:hypothetical protein